MGTCAILPVRWTSSGCLCHRGAHAARLRGGQGLELGEQTNPGAQAPFLGANATMVESWSWRLVPGLVFAVAERAFEPFWWASCQVQVLGTETEPGLWHHLVDCCSVAQQKSLEAYEAGPGPAFESEPSVCCSRTAKGCKSSALVFKVRKSLQSSKRASFQLCRGHLGVRSGPVRRQETDVGDGGGERDS